MVIGLITFVLLGARLALCLWHTCFRFVRKHYHVAARFWDESRAKLVAVRGLLIFAQSDWTPAWHTGVFSTDSSLSGWGMTHGDWPELVVGRTGRLSERRRFISNGPGARESALAASCVVLDDGQWIVEDADDEYEEVGFNIDPSFAEVPSMWFDPGRWNVSGFSCWTRSETSSSWRPEHG